MVVHFLLQIFVYRNLLVLEFLTSFSGLKSGHNPSDPWVHYNSMQLNVSGDTEWSNAFPNWQEASEAHLTCNLTGIIAPILGEFCQG